jgi:hypothetical protein
MKRRWDDDVVFKNQSRGSEKKDGQEFVNVCSLRMMSLWVLCANVGTSRICCAPTSTRDSWYVHASIPDTLEMSVVC